jgi:hypothetical protein
VLAIFASVAAGGCGGGSGSTKAPTIETAKPFADDFVRKLVVGGRWDAVVDGVSPLLRRELRTFQLTIRRDGVRQVVGSGVLRHDCPANRVVQAGKDCYAYKLRGTQVVPGAGIQRINARFRLWFSYEDGSWQVINYDYNVVL